LSKLSGSDMLSADNPLPYMKTELKSELGVQVRSVYLGSAGGNVRLMPFCLWLKKEADRTRLLGLLQVLC
jgi:hypothetical protein